MKDKVTVIAADDRRIFRKGPKSLLSEKEHIQVFADGHCNQEVADIICISRKTVKNHRAHIVRKTGVQGQVGLTTYAARIWLIDLDLWD
ncbi:MAG TPA: helix-turn-helix transcriptional regulator [Desulfatiglandales bacterium]|nr:helix-turn-helix transcriptional regulator [Desulfatiglandales bacterium]